MRKRQRKKGKFWPPVREEIWLKAQELFQEERQVLHEDFSGVTATREELWEGGFFHRAKLLVLRALYAQSKGLPSAEEEEIIGRYGKDALPTT